MRRKGGEGGYEGEQVTKQGINFFFIGEHFWEVSLGLQRGEFESWSWED